MTRYTTTREALQAHLRGEATLEEVSDAADRSLARHLEAVGYRPQPASTQLPTPQRPTE
jgi:hypothetical protein